MKVSIKKLKDDSRTKHWMVCYYVKRKPVRSFFASEEEAKEHRKSLRQTFKSGAKPEEIAEALLLIGGLGYKLQDVVKAGLATIKSTKATGASPTATFTDGANQAIANAKENNRRQKTIDGYESSFCSRKKAFGPKVIATITETEVRDYLNSLCDRQGRPGMAATATKVSTLCHITMAMRAVGIENPLPKLKIPKDELKEIQFFTNSEISTILGATRPCERGMVAMAIFAAIRPETLEKLPADCVKITDRIIVIPGNVSKDHKRHVLKGMHTLKKDWVLPGVPEILWQWLSEYPFEPQAWHPLQKRLRKSLGGKWIHDGLRHTGATNYSALFGIAPTGELLTHGGQSLVLEHYDGGTTREKADKFFEITPSSVLFSPKLPQIDRYPFIQWPPNDELAKLVNEMPSYKVGKLLGCTGPHVKKRCVEQGITTPGRGAWMNGELRQKKSAI